MTQKFKKKSRTNDFTASELADATFYGFLFTIPLLD